MTPYTRRSHPAWAVADKPPLSWHPDDLLSSYVNLPICGNHVYRSPLPEERTSVYRNVYQASGYGCAVAVPGGNAAPDVPATGKWAVRLPPGTRDATVHP